MFGPLSTPDEKHECTAKSTRWKPPTVEEVQAYIDEKGYNIDAEYWWNFYNSKNWMIGKNKMSKWKSAVATWARGNGNSGRVSGSRPKLKELGDIG